MLVIKRDKKVEPFDVNKIDAAITKAFNAVNEPIDSDILQDIKDELYINNIVSVEELQDQLEKALMACDYYDVAKAFILYRRKRAESRALNEKKQFIKDYAKAKNAATGSKYDANANVTEKNIVTLNGELFKGDVIKVNRAILTDKIRELYGEELAKEYIRMLEQHLLYKHDETSIMPYCVAITMYPFLLEGLQPIGGLSARPKNLDSFCGMFVNLVFAISSQFAGAVATGEFLMYFDYFARKEWGDDYWKRPEEMVDKHRNIDKTLEQKFQQIVYSINQPAAARNFQSVFWNISYFDKNYFEGIFGEFYFPDGTQPQWESLSWLQKKFAKWFNEERTKCILTFPVETMALLTNGEDVVDEEYADFTAEMYSKGHSFFTYMSDSPDSLSSCCRLRNEVTDNQFSYSLGAGGIATGSKSVMTLNINRLVQDAVNNGYDMIEYLRENVKKVHKFQTAYNELLKDYLKDGLLTVYTAGFIDMKKQYLTIGVNGVIEAAEFLGIPVNDNPTYREFMQSILKTISDENRKARTKELMFNTEFVPAENLGVKHANWDRKAGYVVPRDCYNSYFYAVEDTSLTVLDKFKLHGKEYVQYLDGGSALHMNLDEHLSKEQYRNLLRVAAVNGTNYFTFNIPNTICNDCGHIDKRYLKECPKCGSKNVDYATRVIGYLKRISNFSQARQEEASRRFYTHA
ncbi:MAG: anaerobic ribonucleoside-triphosphate reductase [Lachnospira pectinoschiza]|jgi:ribonucleoside-triphosphate reductase|nr:MAG: anaerobic ribonucleoside-triphosphate reductase [Bacteriophage sp.]UVX67363.1 MAG: anaerobic ribonucleoside-triphosphate reductase [Bacteriophage sp.]UVX74035.1 MAG: anaerobic ribonucleoside-triphosphate reductase [Bacteriophage sp.]UWF87385.1 MAG: anaerobic ribonucleoside-triphosphate reductase [Bacteriophage sp.]